MRLLVSRRWSFCPICRKSKRRSMLLLKRIKQLSLLLCCAVFLLVSAPGYCADTTTAQPPQTIEMSLTQYNRLKEIISQQEVTLDTLQARLNVLKSNSTEQQQLLIKLQEQLQDCRNQLQETRLNLTSAKDSLTKADETLQRQSQSLQKLTRQIKAMEHKQAVIKRQRDTWAVTAGMLLAGLAVK